MDASHHMAAIMEVDLRARTCHPNTLVDRINALPALKTSAAFFSFLRANLVLPPSEMPSNVSTPVVGPVAAKGGSATATATATATCVVSEPRGSGAAVSLDDIPPLTLGVLATRADKVDALQLVADSIAQQRQVSSRHLALHPVNVTVLAVVLGVGYQLNDRRDMGTLMLLLSGALMSYLMAIRYVSARYIPVAESLNWGWLRKPSSRSEGGPDADADADAETETETAEEDTIIGARFGKEMIGALVLRLAPPSGAASAATAAAAPARKKNASRGNASNNLAAHLVGGHGVIRAWTTKLRYRRRGIGGDLLEEAVRVTREHCGPDAAVGFAPDHANSRRVLPELYNGPFRQSERLAARTLNKTLANHDGKR